MSRERGPLAWSGSHSGPAGLWLGSGVAVATWRLVPVRAWRMVVSRAGVGSHTSTGVLMLAGVGELEVAGEFAGQAVRGFAGPVVLEEEVDPAVVFAPAAIAVGADQAAPVGGAGAARTTTAPAPHPGRRRACWARAAEEAVDPDQVGEALGVGQGQGAVAAVADEGRDGVGVVVGGEQGGAEGAEDVVVGGAAGGVVGPEPVDQPEPLQGGQAVLGGVAVAEGELGELVGGEDPVLGQQPAQLPVAVGHPAGDGGQPFGGARPTDVSRSPSTTSCGRRGGRGAERVAR